MKLTPIQVNRSLLYQTTSGPLKVTPTSFGYAQLIATPSVTEEQLLSITAVPPLPDGIFTAHVDKRLYVCNVKNSEVFWVIVSDSQFQRCVPSDLRMPACGSFASLDEVKQAFPEYFI